MKKLVVLVVAVCFAIISGGNALANEPSVDPLNRHAVWTNWFDNEGNRVTQTIVTDQLNAGLERKVSIQPMDKIKMKGETRDFDFIHETEYYDYAEDHKDSA